MPSFQSFQRKRGVSLGLSEGFAKIGGGIIFEKDLLGLTVWPEMMVFRLGQRIESSYVLQICFGTKRC